MEAGVIVYRVSADMSELTRAEGQANAAFQRIGQQGQDAFARITQALDEAARLIAGALAAAFDLSPDQLVAGAQRAGQALDRLRAAADQAGDEIDRTGREMREEAQSATEAERATTDLGEAMQTASERTGGLLERLGQLGMTAIGVQALAQSVHQLTAPLAEFGRTAIAAASDANESFSKLQAVFQEATIVLQNAIDESATAMGLSRGEAAEALATFGNLFTSLGFGRVQAAEMSEALVRLAADIASFNNLQLDEALMKLRSGLLGEIEPLRSIGVAFNETTVQAKALEMGLASSTKELTEQAKIMARFQLIMEMTKNAQGDFARTSDQLANSQRILRAQIQNLRESLGAALLPIMTTIVRGAAAFIQAIERMPGPIRDVVIAIAGASAGLGALVPILGAISIAAGALSAPMLTIIAAATALAAVAMVVYRNWDQIRERFPIVGRAVDAVRTAFERLADGVRAVLPAIGATVGGVVDIISAQFQKVVALLGGIGRAIAAAFKGEFSQIDDIARETSQRINELSQEQAAAGQRIVDAWRNVGQAARETIPPFYALFTAMREGGGAASQIAASMVETITVFQQFDSALDASRSAMNRWRSQLQEARQSLEQLEEKRRSGVELTAEEQRQYEILTWYVGRLEGGLADLQAQQRSILVAQAEYTRALDELNRELEEGRITQEEYNRRVGELNAQYSAALGPAEQFKQAGERVADALKQVADRLEDVLRNLGLLPPRVEIDIESTAERQAELIRRLNMEIDRLPSSVSITANVNIAPALDNLARLGRNLPHSPAEEGPLSREPNWRWLFEGLATAAGQATSEALGRLREFAGGVREVLASIREAFSLVSVWQRQGDPWEAAWGELLDWFQGLADRAIRGLTDVARQFDQEALRRVRDLVDAVSAVMRALREVVEVASRWEDIGDPWDLAWGELTGWLEQLATGLIETLSRAANAVGVEAVVQAQQLAESMRTVFDFVGSVFRVADQGTVRLLANVQTLWANRDTIARSVSELAVSLVAAVRDGLARAGDALPDREQVENLLGPVSHVVGLLDRMSRLTEEGLATGQAAIGRVQQLSGTLVQLASEVAQAVRAATAAAELPERDLTDRLFAPLQAVANLLSTLDRLGSASGRGEERRPVDPVAMLRSLLDAVRQVVEGLTGLAAVQLPPLDQLASLLGVLDVIERVSESLGGSLDRLARVGDARGAAAAATSFVGAVRAWVQELAALATELEPGVAEAISHVAGVFEPLGRLVQDVGAILNQASQAPRNWEARVREFARAVAAVLQSIADVRAGLADGLEGLAEVIAQWNAALGTLAGTANGTIATTINATQHIDLQASIAADVQVRVWIGESELRSIVRQEVDAAVREALVSAV